MLFLTVYVSTDAADYGDVVDRCSRLAGELRISVRFIEIDGVRDLEEKWASQVPAGVMRGKVIFHNGLDEASVRQKVRMLQR